MKEATMTTITIPVREIHCEGCENSIAAALSRMEGVHSVQPDHRTNRVRVAYDEASVSEAGLREAPGRDRLRTGRRVTRRATDPEIREASGMRIGQLAGELGLNPRTIRYYEGIGLLPQPERTGGNYRAYAQEDVQRLRFIRAAQRLGLTLDEIREVLAFAERGEPPCGFVRERLRREVAAIDARIAELQALRGELAGLEAKAERLPPPAPGEYCPLVHVNQNPSPPATATAARPRGHAGQPQPGRAAAGVPGHRGSMAAGEPA
jgi:DNA-binding transcriptional MerR regulator/copper chaperone CopZ